MEGGGEVCGECEEAEELKQERKKDGYKQRFQPPTSRQKDKASGVEEGRARITQWSILAASAPALQPETRG